MCKGILLKKNSQAPEEGKLPALWNVGIPIHTQSVKISQRGFFIAFNGSSVILERGRFGGTSLFYTLSIPGGLVYATDLKEIQSVLKETGFSREAFADLLRLGYVPAPRTIFQDIRKVPANHRVLIDLSTGAERIEKMAKLPPIRHDLTIENAATELKRLLVKATERCLERCNGRAAPLLSGGIDSGIVTAILQRHFPDAAREAVTVVYGDADYDEAPVARQSAQLSRIPLREIVLSPEDVTALLPTLMGTAGEPFSDASLIACAKAYAAIPEESAVFTGDGGDELFGGYRRYRAMTLREAVPGWLSPAVRGLCRLGAAALPEAQDNRSKLATVKRFLQMCALPSAEAYASFQQLCTAATAAAVAPTLPFPAPFLQRWTNEMKDSPADVLQSCNALDLQYYLPEDGARKCEIAAAYANRTVCSPLLDNDIADFALSLPQEMRFNSRNGKLLLRHLAVQELLLPEAALHAPKRGFGLPLARWFRSGPLADDITRIIHSLPVWDTEHLFNTPRLEELLHEHQASQKNHAPLLWLIACLYYWKVSLQKATPPSSQG